jgi:hypothetical protein
MPALNSFPLETTLPGQTRRRTWSHPELTTHSVLVLTFDRLYLAPQTGTPKSEYLEAIESGTDLDDMMGPLAVVLDLANIRQLSFDLLTNSLIVEYAGSGLGKSSVRIGFATPEAADACFTKIWRRLGEGFRLTPYQRDTWPTIRAPLLLLAAVLLATAVIAGLLSLHEDRTLVRLPTRGAPGMVDAAFHAESVRSTWDSMLDVVNWKVICGLGGAAAAVAQVWIYRRLTMPPVALELVRA